MGSSWRMVRRWIHGRKTIQLLKGEFIGFIKAWSMHLIRKYYETKSLGMIRNGIEEQQINKILSKHHHISIQHYHWKWTHSKEAYIYDTKHRFKKKCISTIQHGNYFWEMKLTYILDINDASWYTIACQQKVSKDNIINSTEIVTGLLAVPLPHQEILAKDFKNPLYHIIASDWTELFANYTFSRK